MPIELDHTQILEAFLRRGGTLRYRTTRTPGVIEAGEKESAFVLESVGAGVAEGSSIEEAVHSYTCAHLGLTTGSH